MYYAYLQSSQINSQHCWEKDQLEKEVTHQSHQGYDAELLHGIVECSYSKDYHTSQGQKVTSDGPSLLAQTNSNTMLDLTCVHQVFKHRKGTINHISESATMQVEMRVEQTKAMFNCSYCILSAYTCIYLQVHAILDTNYYYICTHAGIT